MKSLPLILETFTGGKERTGHDKIFKGDEFFSISPEDIFLRLQVFIRRENLRYVYRNKFLSMDQLDPNIFGCRFELFVICQITAFMHYKRLDEQLYFWRINHGAEVDMLLFKGNQPYSQRNRN
jgi:hypothetical protein